MDVRTLLESAYDAFNNRNVEAALQLMTQDVSWPKASEGGKVIGKEEIQKYWNRQWAQFDPRVTPLAISEASDGRWNVRVRQIVRSRAGDLLSDSEVSHSFTIENGLIRAMDLSEGCNSETTPSQAFSHHS